VFLSILVEMTYAKFPARWSVSRKSFSTARPRGRLVSNRSRQPGPPRMESSEAIVAGPWLATKRLTWSVTDPQAVAAERILLEAAGEMCGSHPDERELRLVRYVLETLPNGV
jgi:hypothetical protein